MSEGHAALRGVISMPTRVSAAQYTLLTFVFIGVLSAFVDMIPTPQEEMAGYPEVRVLNVMTFASLRSPAFHLHLGTGVFHILVVTGLGVVFVRSIWALDPVSRWLDRFRKRVTTEEAKDKLVKGED